jgi:hypothetical protein
MKKNFPFIFVFILIFGTGCNQLNLTTLLENTEMINGVLIAQAGGPPPQHQVDPEWPKFLGKIKVVFENETVVEKSGYVITIGDPVIAE